MGVTVEPATVFRGHRRRFLTREAAERSIAKAAIRKRWQDGGDDWRNVDPVRIQRMIRLYVAMFVRPLPLRSPHER